MTLTCTPLFTAIMIMYVKFDDECEKLVDISERLHPNDIYIYYRVVQEVMVMHVRDCRKDLTL